MGNKARRRERETERERNLRRRGRGGEQHSGERKQRRLIFAHWSKSTTLANAQHLRIY
jgi:hypothetical protein